MAGRIEQVDSGFGELLERLAGEPVPPRLAPDAPVKPGTSLTAAQALACFESQATSRHLDYAARALRARGEGYYTIGSAGIDAFVSSSGPGPKPGAIIVQ